MAAGGGITSKSDARGRSATLVILAACVLALVGAVLPGAASATEVNTWGPPAPLPAGSVPSGDEPNGDLLLGSTGGRIMRYALQEEIPNVSFFEPGGTLGTLQRVTGSEPEGKKGAVAFLPGGAAVVSLVPEAGRPLGLTVRAADGAYGPFFAGTSSKPIKGFAAREGEVLLARERIGPNARPLVEVATLTIGSGGTLTESGSQALFELPAEDTFVDFFRSIAVAMGPDGSADVTMLTENEGMDSENHLFARNEVLDFHRASAGDSWGGGGNLAAGLPFAAQANELQAAAAPDGRAILAFRTSEPTPINSSLRSDSSHLYESLREPEGSFSGPVQVTAATAPEAGSALTRALVAAGADGTLALAYRTETCQTISPEAAAETYGVLVAAPGRSPGSLPLLGESSEDDTSQITALGAGHGQAVVGIGDKEVTVGEGDNLCEFHPEMPGSETARYDDRAVVVGSPEPLDEDEFTTREAKLGEDVDSGGLFIDAAAIDEVGDAAVTGALGTANGTEYAYFTGSGKLYGGGTLEGGETGGPGGGGTGGGSDEVGGQGGSGEIGGGTQTGGSGSPSTPGSGSSAPPGGSTTTPTKHPSPAKCKKGTRRELVKGKDRCVKVKKKRHHRRQSH